MSPLAYLPLALAALLVVASADPDPYYQEFNNGRKTDITRYFEMEIHPVGFTTRLPDRCTRPGLQLVGQHVVARLDNPGPGVTQARQTEDPPYDIDIQCPKYKPDCIYLLKVTQYCDMAVPPVPKVNG